MQPYGESVNDIQPRAILSLLQKGMHPDDVIAQVVDATMEMADRAGLGWTREVEVRHVTSRCVSSLRKLQSEYDPSTGVIPTWLAGEFHDAWAEALRQGRRPQLGRNPSGFYVRAYGPATTGNDTKADDSSGSSKHTGNGDTETEAPKAKEEKRSRFADIQWFEPLDEASLAPRRYLYGKHYQRGTVSGTIAPGGVGKSTQGIVDALAMATGRNLTGEQPEERCRVWIHNGEDGVDELNRRIVGACKFYGIAQEELKGWLIITSGTQFPLKIANGYSDLKIVDTLVDEMTRFITEREIDAAIFDPLVTLHGTDGNSPDKMDAVIRIFKQIAEVCDCAVELAHHTRKLPYGASEFSIDDARGAGSVKDALRVVRLFNIMSKEEASNLGINEFERLSYFRVDRGKANYQPPAKSAVWRKFESIELANGDNVGVITAWNHPGQGGPHTEAQKAQAYGDEQVFMHLLDRFTLDGRYVSDKPSPSYAPKVFAEEEEAKTAKVSKHRLKDAMRRLFATKQIRLEEYDRGSSRGAGTRLARASQGPLMPVSTTT
jgi:RecA-family ATPase